MLGVQVPGHQEGRSLAKFCLQTCLSDRYLLPVLPFLSQVFFFFLTETSSFSLPSPFPLGPASSLPPPQTHVISNHLTSASHDFVSLCHHAYKLPISRNSSHFFGGDLTFSPLSQALSNSCCPPPSSVSADGLTSICTQGDRNQNQASGSCYLKGLFNQQSTLMNLDL